MKYTLLKLCCLTVFLFSVPDLHSQNYRLDAGFMVGAANYLGDIGGKYLERRNFVSDIKLKQTSLSGGLFGRYALTPRLSLNMAVSMGRIRGADSLSTNPARNSRNLSFRNDIKELGLSAEYELYEAYNIGGNTRYRVDYSLYGLFGFGYFMHNPQAKYDGVVNGKVVGGWHDLQPLKTEGVSYSKTGIATILGFGMDFTLDRNYRIGWKIGIRTTTTDYLDDISTVYADPDAFAQTDEGQLARALSNRSAEGGQGIQGNVKGRIRGSSKYDDSYVFSTFNFSYVFKGKGQKYQRQFHNGYIRKKGKRLSVSRFFAF